MRAVNFIIIFCVIVISSCKDQNTKGESANTDTVASMKMATDTNSLTAAIDSMHTAQNLLDWKGTYKGVLPSADYEGIETEIMLHADNTYMISTKTQKPKTKSALYNERKGDGKFTWMDGSTIELDGIKNAPSKYFIAENKLIPLDSAGKKIEGADAGKFILTKN